MEDDYRPIVTRLPEAVQAEAEAIAEAERLAEDERRKRDAAESDVDRLARESAEQTPNP